MNDFIKHIQPDLASDCFHERSAANLAILGYDLGRANTEKERDNARNEYNFRMLAFDGLCGLKDAMRITRKYR